jgi:chemotaxis signal transduction protein
MLVMIEGLSQFKSRYLVEAKSEKEAVEWFAKANKVDDGSVAVTEFDQMYLGEVVLSVEAISRKQAQKIHESPLVRETVSPWMELDTLINEV